MIRRFVGLIWGLDGKVEVVRDWSQSPSYLWPKMAPLLAWLEERGFDDWHDIGRDAGVEAFISSRLPYELSRLDFHAHPITTYVGPSKPKTSGRSAILELGPEALEAIGYLEPYPCPVKGCEETVRVPTNITPGIYSCPCRAARIHVRLPRYGEKVGRRFVLEEVR